MVRDTGRALGDFVIPYPHTRVSVPHYPRNVAPHTQVTPKYSHVRHSPYCTGNFGYRVIAPYTVPLRAPYGPSIIRRGRRSRAGARPAPTLPGGPWTAWVRLPRLPHHGSTRAWRGRCRRS